MNPGETKWKLELEDVLYGGNRITKNDTEKYAMFDTGRSFVHIAGNDFKILQSHW